MKQRKAVLDAPSPDQEIDGRANGDAARAQGTEIAGGGYGDCIARHRYNVKTTKQPHHLACGTLVCKTLQDFAKHQIANNDFALAEQLTQASDMRHISAVEKVD